MTGVRSTTSTASQNILHLYIGIKSLFRVWASL